VNESTETRDMMVLHWHVMIIILFNARVEIFSQRYAVILTHSCITTFHQGHTNLWHTAVYSKHVLFYVGDCYIRVH